MSINTFRAGQITLASAGSASALSAIPHNMGSTILRAMPGNSGTIYIGGDNTVSATTGFPLQPGEMVIVDIPDPSSVFARPSVNGLILAWAGVSA